MAPTDDGCYEYNQLKACAGKQKTQAESGMTDRFVSTLSYCSPACVLQLHAAAASGMIAAVQNSSIAPNIAALSPNTAGAVGLHRSMNAIIARKCPPSRYSRHIYRWVGVRCARHVVNQSSSYQRSQRSTKQKTPVAD